MPHTRRLPTDDQNDTDKRQDKRAFSETGVDCTGQVLTHTWNLTDSVFDVRRYTENPVHPKEVEARVRSYGETPLHRSTETQSTNKNEGREEAHSDQLHDLPDWLQEFREISVDESGPLEPRGNPAPKDQDTSSSFHELPMEWRAQVEPGSGKHSACTHFPKDPNCDICL